MSEPAEHARLKATEIMDATRWSMSAASYETVHALVAHAYAVGVVDGRDEILREWDRHLTAREAMQA